MEEMMRSLRALILVPALMVAAACGDEPAVDAALDSDLRLAGEAAPGMDTLSLMEQQRAQSQLVTTAPRRTSVAPARRTTSAPRRTTSTVSASAPARQTTVVKNTKRDAAIGAAAGAVIGATTSKNKVKGGLIGAAIGGLAGAVIGNNIDVERR
jgi:uncharacterized protein YcfJ